MAIKGQENLIPFTERTVEEQREIARQGGIASGKARQEKATMKATLEMMLETTNKKGYKYKDNVALGLIANAIDKTKGGNPEAYKTIAKMLGELDSFNETQETPSVQINIVDNNSLEKVLYENNHKS